METDQVCDGAQRSQGVGFPADEPHNKARFKRVDELPSKFSQIWTKRQNPEWKPRRASVAACQQQQQLMAQHNGYKTTYQFNLTSANIKELIVQKRLQHYQQQRNELGRCVHNDELAGRLGDLDIRPGKECEIVPQEAGQTAPRPRESRCASATIGANINRSTNLLATGEEQLARKRFGGPVSVSTDTTTITTATPPISATPNCDLGEEQPASLTCKCAENELDNTSSASSMRDEISRAVNKPVPNEKFAGNQKPSDSTTCCAAAATTATAMAGAGVGAGANFETETVSFDGGGGKREDANIQDIPTCESMSEKLHIQNKQRKHVILSMALKQMMAEQHCNPVGACESKSPVLGQDGCQCGCRSRSCSVSSAKLPSRSVATALTSSKSVLFDGDHDATGARTVTTVPVDESILPDDRQLVVAETERVRNDDEGIHFGPVIVGSQDRPARKDAGKSLADMTPQPKRRYSGALELTRAQDERNVFRPQASTQLKQQQQSSSIGLDLGACESNSMQQLVTSKNSPPECDSCIEHHAHQWRHQSIPTDQSTDHDGREFDDFELPRPGSTLDQWHGKTTAQTRARKESSRRSCSALGKSNNAATSSVQSPSGAQASAAAYNLEALIVESWLDDHPNFTRDYIMRKATRQVVDDWLVANAKVSNTNLSSQLDLRSIHTISRPVSQISLGGYLREPSWRGSELMAADIDEYDVQQGSTFGSLRANRSNSQSASVTNRAQGFAVPIRKISATDFETRTGSGFLRPMLSKTPDGRLTFLPQSSLFAAREQIDCLHETGADRLSRRPDGHQSRSGESAQPDRLSGANIEPGRAGQQHLQRQSSSGHCDERPVHHETEAAEQRRRRVWRRGRASTEADAELGEASDDDDDDGEVKLIFELVKNIYDDLDIRTLLHKILKNIAVLINADRSSLFLVCGGPNDPNRRLVSQLFNVDQDSIEVGEPDESITIPWGTGLVGFVAASGEAVNINDCYEDPRFTDAIDQRTGYVTKHMLCAPILDKRNEIVGVAQVINKRDGNAFSKSDELKFKRYLQFCGIGLRNAQSYEQCQLENRRNQVLLDLARMVFEEQSTIEQVVYRIMLHTQSLLDCERCQVLLIDDANDELENLHKFSTNHYSTHQANDVAARRRVDKCSQYRAMLLENKQRATCLQSDQQDIVGDGDGEGDIDCECGDQLGPKTGTDIIVDRPPPKLFSLVFDLECDGNDPVIHNSKEEEEGKEAQESKSGASAKSSRAFPVNIGITGYVALTGETLNIENAHQHERFDVSVDEGSDFKHKSILCMPIRNGQRQIIGVIQLINKKNGQPFNKNDEDLFEAFAIFCGLGIHNTLMYERVLKVMAKQRVTFEVLSYHATAPLEEAKKLSQEQIPSCFALNLASLKFNDFSLDEQYMLKSCLRFFLDLDLIRRFQIDQLVFCNWILSVQKNYRKVTYHPIVGQSFLLKLTEISRQLYNSTYRNSLRYGASSQRYVVPRNAMQGGNGLKASPVRYHNWRHAFNVSQMMFAILVNTQICQALGELETLALLIACLCHDLDHRGTNNSFQIKSASPLAELYSTSTMEHHHFDQCVMILNSQGNQILANLSPEEYSRVIMLLEEAILATDLANYFRNRDHFFQLINSNKFDWQNDPSHRSLLRCMLMTACDVAAITKPWPVQKVVADLVMSEFYQQGDIEKNELNIEPIDMMNRDKMSELPSMQIGFIDNICAPIYAAFAKLFPNELTTLLDGCLANRSLWQEVATSSRPTPPVPEATSPINYLLCDNADEASEKQPSLPDSSASRSDTDLACLVLHQHDCATLKKRKNPMETGEKVIKLPFESPDRIKATSESSRDGWSARATRLTSQRKSV